MSRSSPEEIVAKQRKALSHYQGYDYLDAGAQGMVSVCMETDQHGTILSRTAVKDTYLDQFHWDHMEWIDGYPADIGATWRLQDQTSSNKVLHIEGSRVFLDLRMYRMFLEFAPHASLWSTLDRYWTANKRVPEAFLWNVAKSMVEMGVLMGQGDLVTPKSPWRTLVHKDIKLDNVVLAAPTADFPSYPTPKLMDFGHVGEIWPGNPISMAEQCWGGTQGWKAVERLPADDPPGPMTQASDVYSFGLTLYHLMNLSGGGPPRYTQDGQPAFGPGDPGSLFSPGLKDMVLECLHIDLRQRPSFGLLHAHIRAVLESPSGDPEMQRIQALSTRTLAQTGRYIPMSEITRYTLSYRGDDKYRLGTACRFLQ
nr:hypothetical protein B0A51_05264 [Rachicladosporium sp. CCFEE 5018]